MSTIRPTKSSPPPTPSPAFDPKGLEADRNALIRWFEGHRRDLPWRIAFAPGPISENLVRENAAYGRGPAGSEPGHLPRPLRDPYRTWIAEIMLQQTQVATVSAYFDRWMGRFPDLASLAAAREDEVLALWAGLGYYSRVRNILETARRLQVEGGGEFPRTREGLLALKGIGEYTAGAILSLAFGLPEPILDGNLVRVFSRYYGLEYLPGDAKGRQRYWETAREWARGPSPELANEGLMELGALVCTPRQPLCDRCPLQAGCYARRHGRQGDFPPPKSRATAVEMEGTALVIACNGEVLLHRPRKPQLLAGLWTFPVFPAGAVGARDSLEREWRESFPGLPLPVFGVPAGYVRHSITRHRIGLTVVAGTLPPGARGQPLPEGYGWWPGEGLESALVSSLPRKIWRAFRGGEGQTALAL